MTPCKNVRPRLVIIHHAREKLLNPKRHLLHLFLPLWKKAGIEVIEVFGTNQAPAADIAFLHVDLSVIPQEYLDLAQKYPVTINGKIADIRKSNLSQLRLKSDSSYSGPVVVKTSLNHAGIPEEAYWSRPRRIARRLLAPFSSASLFASKDSYRIYQNPTEVPAAAWDSPDLVVEKLRTEIHEGRYCLREWYFLGNKSAQRVELSPDPLFTQGELVHHLDQPVPQNLQALREKLGFDYGKFDYTVVDGEAVAFDFNKTIGVMNPGDPMVENMTHQLVHGLETFFPSPILPTH